MKFSSEQVSAALIGRRAVKEYPFPSADGVRIAIRLLTDEELDGVRIEAVEFAKAHKVDLQWDPDFLDRVINRHVVLKAFLDPETGKPFFETIGQVGQLDNLLLRTLMELYHSHVQALDPLSSVPAEEVGKLVELMGKSETPAALLSLYERPTLVSLLLSMAHLLRAK